MYANAHWRYDKNRGSLVEWSTNFVVVCVHPKIMGSGSNAGREYTVVHNPMHSLRKYSEISNNVVHMWPAYTDQEKKLYYPNREWEISGYKM